MTLLDGLISYWALNEASDDALDLHGSKTLTAVNAPAAQTGHVYATAREFAPASTQYFTRTDAALRGGADFTVAIWFNAYTLQTTPTYHMLADCLSSAGGWAVGSWGSDSSASAFLQIGSGGGGFYPAAHASMAGPTLNRWWFFIGWLDYAAKTSYAWLDNVAGEEKTSVNSAVAGDSPLRVGTQMAAAAQWWDGMIGPAMFWNRVLSEAERTELWHSSAGMTYADFSLAEPGAKRVAIRKA